MRNICILLSFKFYEWLIILVDVKIVVHLYNHIFTSKMTQPNQYICISFLEELF